MGADVFLQRPIAAPMARFVRMEGLVTRKLTATLLAAFPLALVHQHRVSGSLHPRSLLVVATSRLCATTGAPVHPKLAAHRAARVSGAGPATPQRRVVMLVASLEIAVSWQGA